MFLSSVLAGATAWAGGVETQHAFDVTVPLKSSLDVILHSRIRTQPGRLGVYQVRGGPILSWAARPRFSVLGGYYYARQQRLVDLDYLGGHRFFGGVEVDVAKGRRWSFDQRAVAERFLLDSSIDYSRYRFRSRLSANGPLAPYTSHEFLFDAQGWRSSRHSAGIRWDPLPHVQVDFGYFYEPRRPDAGGNRHMWLTSIHWKQTPRLADPDL